MMDEQQIAARLLAAHNAFVEKMGTRPYIGPKLEIDNDGRRLAFLYVDISMDKRIGASAATAAEALDKLDAAIAAVSENAISFKGEME